MSRLGCANDAKNRPIGKIPALLAVGMLLPWLFPPTFQNDVIAPVIEVFGGFTASPLAS